MGRSFSSTNSEAIRSLSSARLKKVSLRKRARIQRCATNTPTSTFALSLGLRGRAGITTAP